MSLIGKKPVEVPANVKVKIEGKTVLVEGPKGKLEWAMPQLTEASLDGSRIIVKRTKENKAASSMHGLARAYIGNMVKGVSEGFTKDLEIQGIGFRAQVEGKNLTLQLGFTHQIMHPIPEGLVVKTPKPTQISVEGADKALVGEFAAEVRDYFRPEPYKGKGIRYAGEYVRKKAGKAVA